MIKNFFWKKLEIFRFSTITFLIDLFISRKRCLMAGWARKKTKFWYKMSILCEKNWNFFVFRPLLRFLASSSLKLFGNRSFLLVRIEFSWFVTFWTYKFFFSFEVIFGFYDKNYRIWLFRLNGHKYCQFFPWFLMRMTSSIFW